MGTTDNGLPFPEGTDAVMDGDDAIQALAEAIDPRLPWTAAAYGRVSVAFTDGVGVTTVTLPTGRFATAPTTVLVSITSGASSTSGATVRATSITATSFQIVVSGGVGAGTPLVSWQAIL